MIVCEYGVSARMIPARNAPKESENPIALVAKLNPKSTNSDMATKTSFVQFSLQMARKPSRASCRPPNAKTPRSRKDVAPPAARMGTSTPPSAPPLLNDCNTGNKMMNGTTAKSWNSSTPRLAVPNFVVNILRSARSCKPNAEDESDSAKPMTTASKTELTCNISSFPGWINSKTFVPSASPAGKSAEANTKFTNSTCVSPRPNAYLAKPLNFFDDNSKPISNSKN